MVLKVRKFVSHAALSVVTGALMVGCGAASNPDAVKVSDLRPAGSLSIADLGSGSVKLTWAGMNNEDDFSGYNVYGVKDNADVAKLDGQAIQLLDAKGAVVDASKTLLTKMAYNGTDWESAGTTKDTGGDLNFFAYYKNKDGDTPIMPSCLPEKTSGSAITCTALAATGKSSSFNGTTSLTLTGLKNDGQYCFAVFATLKSGKKISQTSTNVKCIVPRSKVAYVFSSAISSSTAINLTSVRAACGTTHACTSLTSLIVTPDNLVSSLCTANTTQHLCFEITTSGATGKAQFTSGKYAVIRDLGYYPNGFEDSRLQAAPAVTAALSDIQNNDGYSVMGQSVVMVADHIYSVAESKSTTSTETSYYYHLVKVSSVGTDNQTPTLEFRFSGKADARQ